MPWKYDIQLSLVHAIESFSGQSAISHEGGKILDFLPSIDETFSMSVVFATQLTVTQKSQIIAFPLVLKLVETQV